MLFKIFSSKDRELIYKILWFSIIYQQEWAVGTPMSPPSHLSPYPSLQPVTETLFEFPESYSEVPLAVCFTRGIVNFYVILSLHLPFSLLSFPLSIDLFSTSVSPLLPWKYIHQCHLFRLHVYVSVYNIYISFSDFSLYNRL